MIGSRAGLPRIMSEPFSAIIIVAAFRLADTMTGMIVNYSLAGREFAEVAALGDIGEGDLAARQRIVDDPDAALDDEIDVEILLILTVEDDLLRREAAKPTALLQVGEGNRVEFGKEPDLAEARRLLVFHVLNSQFIAIWVSFRCQPERIAPPDPPTKLRQRPPCKRRSRVVRLRPD